MFRLLAAILVSAWLCHVVFGSRIRARDNFCSVINEYSNNNALKNTAIIRRFIIKPKMELKVYNGDVQFANEEDDVTIICLEYPVPDFPKKICLGCCNLSINKTYYGYSTKLEREYGCGDDAWGNNERIVEYYTENGCELDFTNKTFYQESKNRKNLNVQ